MLPSRCEKRWLTRVQPGCGGSIVGQKGPNRLGQATRNERLRWLEESLSNAKAQFFRIHLGVAIGIPLTKPTVEGPAAAETAPAKAVQEFLKAVLAKDEPALKRILRKEFVEMLENPGGKEAVLGMLDQFYPADVINQLMIVRVFDFGDRAWVEGVSKRRSESGGKPIDVTTRIRTIRVDNAWKVQPM